VEAHLFDAVAVNLRALLPADLGEPQVKHSEQYEADNGDRLDDAERGGTVDQPAP
jgi:hypothetical protein